MPDYGQIMEPLGAFRFTVFVDEISFAVFTECKLPDLKMTPQTIKEGGQNTYVHQLPTRVEPGNLTLKHGIILSSELTKWYMQVVNGDMENALREVTVVLFDAAWQATNLWAFRRAYPINWSGPTLKSDDNAAVVESLEIAHNGFEVL